jgi:hypothetical protein
MVWRRCPTDGPLARLLEQGILKGWPQKFYPSMAHTDEDVARTIPALELVVPGLRG